MRIYIDTSVFGGCFDAEFQVWSNKLIHQVTLGIHTAVISEVSESELKFAPRNVQNILRDIPKQQIEIVRLSNEERQLAEKYILEKAISKKSIADCQHIAVATIHQVDVLVSWNFKHIVNYNRIRLYNAVNLKYGYKMLEIRNPRDLTDES